MRKILKPKILKNERFTNLKNSAKKAIKKGALIALISAGLGSCIGSKVRGCYDRRTRDIDANTVEFYTVGKDSDDEIKIETLDGQEIVLEAGLIAKEVEDFNEPDGKRHIIVLDEEYGKYIEGYASEDNLNLVKTLSKEDFDNYNTIYVIDEEVEANAKNHNFFDSTKTLEEGEIIIGKSKVNADSEVMEGFYIDKEKSFDVEVPIESIKEWQNIKKNETAVVRVLEHGLEHLNMRKLPDIESDIITKIPDGVLVQFTEDEADAIKEGNITWRKVRYVDESGNIEEGYVSDYYLEDAITKIVNVAEDVNGGYLNVRSSANVEDENLIDKITSGKDVFFTSSEVTEDGWVKCYYYEDGKLKEGYVSNKYLKNKDDNSNTFEQLVYKTVGFSDDRVDEIMNNVEINDDGYIVGIDISKMNSEKYVSILEDGTFDITYDSEIKGTTEFTYIKLGATGCQQLLSFTGLMDNASEYIKIATDNNIPYGLYYYSQALDEEEAMIELEEIKSLIEELASRLEKEGYTLNPELPLAIDIESGQYTTNLGKLRDSRTRYKDVTDAQIALMNGMKKEFGTAIIYTSGQWFFGEDKILDLDKYVSAVGDVDIWLVNPSEYKLDEVEKNIYLDRLNYAKEVANGEIEFFQKAQDADYKDGSVDINCITPELFEKLLREQAEAQYALGKLSNEKAVPEKTTIMGNKNNEVKKDDFEEIESKEIDSEIELEI